MQYRYNIVKYATGVLALFTSTDPDDEDISELELFFEPMGIEQDKTKDEWFISMLECGAPCIEEVNELLMTVTNELYKSDPITLKDFIKICESIAIHDENIFSDRLEIHGAR